MSFDVTLKATSRPRGTFRAALIAGLFAMALVGCAASRPAIPVSSESEKETAFASSRGWWYVRFSMQWQQDKEPAWQLDLLLAHQVVAPVLRQHRNEIALWRFHRRAARDQAGHQFSFIFHSSPETARRIFATLQENALLVALKERGVVVRVGCDDPAVNSRPKLEDTSDPHWPPAIQKSWPYYIQGVCEMWLNLIDQTAGASPAGDRPPGLDDLLHRYERINTSVEQLWQEEGQHAFLHHLNAIFGYRPLVVQHKFLLGF